MNSKIFFAAMACLGIYSFLPMSAYAHDKFSISVNLPGQVEQQYPSYPTPAPTYVVEEHHHHHHHEHEAFEWVDMYQGAPLPSHVVTGGYDEYTHAPLFVCRGFYREGLHPGQLVNGQCSFGWGGDEISVPQFQVLVSHYPLNWIPSNNRSGYLPMNAVQGGNQFDGPLFICQANYRGGMHPGKLYKQLCHITSEGREIPMPYYNVLVG